MEKDRKMKLKSMKKNSKFNSIIESKQGGQSEIPHVRTRDSLKNTGNNSGKLDLNFKNLSIKQLRQSLLHSVTPKVLGSENVNMSDISQISNNDSPNIKPDNNKRMFPPIFSSLVRRNVSKNAFSSFFGKENKVIPMNNQEYQQEINAKSFKHYGSVDFGKTIKSEVDSPSNYNPVLQTDISVDEPLNGTKILDRHKTTVSQFANKSFDNNLLNGAKNQDESYSNLSQRSDANSKDSNDNQDQSHIAFNKKNQSRHR